MQLKNWGRFILPMVFLAALPALTSAQISVGVSVNVAPPELPVYEQPEIPGDGYVWTPGYWAWGDDIQDYYWVPGTWVLAPQPEYLWTPGYWGAEGALFLFHPGYWGPHVGFYGGVNYGYGYGGEGYEGGYWRGGRMYYNRSVNNISNTNITNVYNKTVINNVSETRVSYNGGSGGVRAQPTSADHTAAQEHHIAATSVQSQHQQTARGNPGLRASENHGRPPIAATSRPAVFSGAGVIPASRGGAVSPRGAETRTAHPVGSAQPANRQDQQPARAAHPPAEVEQRHAVEQVQPQRQSAPPPRPQPPPRVEQPQRAEAPPPRPQPPPRVEQPQRAEAPPPRSQPPPRAEAPPPRAEQPRPQQAPPRAEPRAAERPPEERDHH